jgi:hypothetical protein
MQHRDPKVDFVVRIHAGSQHCMLAYNRRVFNLWKLFKDSPVYTRGDNKWSNYQRLKEGGNFKNPAGKHITYAAATYRESCSRPVIFFPNA